TSNDISSDSERYIERHPAHQSPDAAHSQPADSAGPNRRRRALCPVTCETGPAQKESAMTDDGSITRIPGTETAILAGGCFWGMEDLIRRQPGVISTRVGYTGGENAHATYRSHPGHAEAVEIVFDPT